MTRISPSSKKMKKKMVGSSENEKSEEKEKTVLGMTESEFEETFEIMFAIKKMRMYLDLKKFEDLNRKIDVAVEKKRAAVDAYDKYLDKHGNGKKKRKGETPEEEARRKKLWRDVRSANEELVEVFKIHGAPKSSV